MGGASRVFGILAAGCLAVAVLTDFTRPALAGAGVLILLGLMAAARRKPARYADLQTLTPQPQTLTPSPASTSTAPFRDPATTYELFISYARADNSPSTGNPQWIEAFLERLNRAHRRQEASDWYIFYDKQEIHGMEDWKKRLLDGLKQAHIMLALVSPRYLGSEPCQWEWDTHTTREQDEGLGRSSIYPLVLQVAPVFKSSHASPEKREELTTWLGSLERPPKDPAAFATALAGHIGDLLARQLDGGEMARLYLLSPDQLLTDPNLDSFFEQMDDDIHQALDKIRRTREAKGNVPERHRFFVGREAELQDLRDALFEKGTGILTSVRGLGGLGKTALAHRYAGEYRADYPGDTWTLECEGGAVNTSRKCPKGYA